MTWCLYSAVEQLEYCMTLFVFSSGATLILYDMVFVFSSGATWILYDIVCIQQWSNFNTVWYGVCIQQMSSLNTVWHGVCIQNKILWVDEKNLVAHCESGIIGQDLERLVRPTVTVVEVHTVLEHFLISLKLTRFNHEFTILHIMWIQYLIMDIWISISLSLRSQVCKYLICIACAPLVQTFLVPNITVWKHCTMPEYGALSYSWGRRVSARVTSPTPWSSVPSEAGWPRGPQAWKRTSTATLKTWYM